MNKSEHVSGESLYGEDSMGDSMGSLSEQV